MKLFVSKNQDAIKDSGDSAYINSSGIYDIIINYVQVAETKNGAYQLNFNINHKNTDQMLYGPMLTTVDGNVNEITQNLLNRLCIIAGMDDGQEIETETAEFPVGKEQKLTEMEVIPELSGLPCKVRVQMEYSLYQNKVQERKAIKAFYREDGATAAEAESGENIGKRLSLDQEKYADNVTYKDGLTEQDIKEWIKQQSSSSEKPSTPTPKATTGAKRPLFNKG